MTPSATHTRSPGKRHAHLFRWISILLPFVFLVLVEIVLRAFHYGHDLHLFIEYPADKEYLVLNPAAPSRYFTNQANATAGYVEPFKKEKDAGTMRIFVLGETTTIGYPYFHNGSFHRWLQYRLMHDYPDRNFEVVNISLTAVNSYAVLGFAREVVNYQPDAILIYTGHNEYYGALGVGSTDRLGGNRRIVDLRLALRQLRIVQWMTNTYEYLAGLFRSDTPNNSGIRMEAMVANEQIPYGSKLYQRGIDQFQENMKETLQLLDRRHIPVFISNLVSNEKDLLPFISLTADSVKFPGFKKCYTRGKAAFDTGDWITAYHSFREAEGIDSMHALCNYYLGRLALRQGDPGQAKAWFSRAEELDALRFRAPSSMNNIIPRLAAEYKSIHLVDAKAAFEARSEYGIVGNELLLEHVHPNLYGYALLSDAFYRAMKAAGILTSVNKESMSLEQLLLSMPILEMDSLTGAYKIGNLKKSWPFNQVVAGAAAAADSSAPSQTASLQGRLAYGIVFEKVDWRNAMDTLYNYYSGEKEWSKAAKVAEALALDHPTEAAFYDRAADLYGALKDDVSAAFWFRRSFSISPGFEKARKIFALYLKLDRPADAIPYLDYAIRNNASGLNLAPVKRLAQEIIQLQQTSRGDGPNLAILNSIAAKYLSIGFNECATRYADSVLKVDPVNKEALSEKRR